MSSATRRLFDLWEAALPLSPAQRSLSLAAAACPDVAPGLVGELPVGARDGALLRLRATLFGPAVMAVSACPQCRERIEVAFTINDLLTDPSPPGIGFGETVVMDVSDGWIITGRVPTGNDLVLIDSAPSAEAAESELWRRCVLEVIVDGSQRSVDEVPAAVRAAVAERLADIDPQADVQLGLSCPECTTEWSQIFDIASFLWKEVDTWARRLLTDVHTLARAYGWSEDEVLRLSPLRRRAYLEMAAA